MSTCILHRWVSRPVRLGLALSALAVAIDSAQAETQTFSIASQWNLITFQVTPTDPSPEAVFGTLAGFQAAWTYDAASGLWLRYIKPAGTTAQQANDSTANTLVALPPIEPGRAYWVFANQSVPAWRVNGTLPQGPVFPSLNFQPGWNLFGVPLGSTGVSNAEPVSLLAVLTAAGLDYDALLTWENQSFRKMFRPQGTPEQLKTNVLAGLPPDLPFPKFDLLKDAGRGYWIHVTDPAVLRPRLVTTVRPDIDAEPLDNFPSKEDLNVSGRVRPASIDEQDTLRFFPGEDVQTVGISNVGDAQGGGGGILIWSAEWIPTTDPATAEPWIRLFTSPSEPEPRGDQGQLLDSHTLVRGVTTLENDTVYLRLDRRNLGRGVHRGRLVLRTSVGDREYQVVAEVPGLEGDFKGYAVIDTVSGKRNKVPDVDLLVSFYEDNKVEGLLRGVIDSSVALLWPVDVPLIGYRVANAGNRFVLSGSYVLPPGDQNGEPYDAFSEVDSAAGVDIDWNNNGRLDVVNPFPFPIQRSVTFEGSLVKGNPTDGYVLEGRYSEIIHGMSKEPLVLLGNFHLERQSARPFTARRSVASDTGVEPVVSKRSSAALAVPAGATRISNLRFDTDLELQNLLVTLQFSAPLPHASLRLVLRSPANPTARELVLYDESLSATGINPKLLEAVTFPLDRPTTGDLLTFVKSVGSTRTDGPNGKFWELALSNRGNQTVTLQSWTLRLEGQPVADVYGVVRNGEVPVSGATVALNGLPFSAYSSPSGADGAFKIARLPLLPLNFTAYRPGFIASDPSQPGLSIDYTRPFFVQPGLAFTAREQRLLARFNPLAGAPAAPAGVAGFPAGTTTVPFELQLRPDATAPPSMAAGPSQATAGSTVDFFGLNLTGEARWEFGDGSGATGASASHVYPKPGAYLARLFSPPDAPSPLDQRWIVALPSPGNAPAKPSDLGGASSGLPAQTAASGYSAYVFQSFASWAGVIPASKVGLDPITGADRYVSDLAPQSSFVVGETNEFGAAYVSAMPLQHAYAASMDIDLAPQVGPANTTGLFASDGFVPLASPGFPGSVNRNEQGFKDEDFNYNHLASLWSNTRTVDGSPEYLQDSENGLIVWGNSAVAPNLNYSTQLYQARDGVDFTFARDDDSYHPHTGVTLLGDLAKNNEVTHYRIACSLGALFVPATVTASSVKVAKARRSQPDNPFDAPLLSSPSADTGNLYFQLRLGVLTSE
ncbi:MAG: PKD domain-containing protein [Verrucomicrobiales bacterium]|nr:PKD domain-containing protein [Verrucomicrobiales bacterium]